MINECLKVSILNCVKTQEASPRSGSSSSLPGIKPFEGGIAAGPAIDIELGFIPGILRVLFESTY
jgi:hypothetical protein